jgi:hypothetical protein
VIVKEGSNKLNNNNISNNASFIKNGTGITQNYDTLWENNKNNKYNKYNNNDSVSASQYHKFYTSKN